MSKFQKMIAIFIVVFACLVATTAYAELPFNPCKEQTNRQFYADPLFADIKKVVIFIGITAHRAEEQKKDFPVELTRDALKVRIKEIVVKNFRPCFLDETENAVIVVDKDNQNNELVNPNNVVFRIDLNWPKLVSEKEKNTYGILKTQVFRSGLPSGTALHALSRSFSFAIFPRGNESSLETTLNKALAEALQPFAWVLPYDIIQHIRPGISPR